MPDLPILTSLPVAWMVSPSVPDLMLRAGESSTNPTTVDFFATHFGGRYARMRLIFDSGYWVKWSPGYADSEPVRMADYDWSNIPLRRPGPDYETTNQRIRTTWEETGLCPNPLAYEVHDSPWLREIDLTGADDEDLRHYLIVGHDVYVEVLATGWHEEEPLDKS